MYWEESDGCCPHRQTETEAEGTQTGEADSEIIPEDVPEAEVPNRERGEDTRPENDPSQCKEAGAGIRPGVPEEELTRVLEELELSLTMTSAMEEKMGSLRGLMADGSTVRCRNKRRKAKKASH